MSCTTVSSNDLGHLKCMGWLSLPKSPFSLKLLHLQSRDRWPSQTMLTVLFSLRDCFRARAVLQAEILALRHQLLVLQCVSPEVRNLIRKMSLASPRWGAPRIHGELLKIGIAVSQATVAKYMVRHRKPPSQTWRTFLKNHAKDLVSADFFVVPTITFQLLFVFVILDHDRRRPIHFAVTSNPTAEWTARQLLEAFPWDNAPRYLLRDRDSIYGEKFCETAKWMGIREVLTAPRSPWQKDYASHCTSWVRCDTTSLARRRRDSFMPWAFRGGLSPGCSYRQWFLSLQVWPRISPWRFHILTHCGVMPSKTAISFPVSRPALRNRS